MGIGTL